eukprot:TRINITY_DN4416_c0_g1_i7.p2 TRINITY_DN4416_c0_g1~~TRINITY_DN4416_c0_g1_i7.p2  ORF type:complete len:116 (+),score=25.60 TRINITY_DN4416_c0_g1_i7:162-509(+)
MSMACRHLLIKYSGSRNPVSRRTGQSTSNVSAEAAEAELNEIIRKLGPECTEEAFAQAALARSDCGSFANGGDLGTFNPGEMQSQFEEGTKETPVGAMSPIVLSDSGYHIIFRTA